jgi:hypothetical protein
VKAYSRSGVTLPRFDRSRLSHRDAALVLSGDSAEGGSIRTQLLADIRPLLIDETIKRLTSEAIVAELVKKPDRPWADWKHGKAITPNALAALLKPFNIIRKGCTFRLTPTPGVTRAMPSKKPSLAIYRPLNVTM